MLAKFSLKDSPKLTLETVIDWCKSDPERALLAGMVLMFSLMALVAVGAL